MNASTAGGGRAVLLGNLSIFFSMAIWSSMLPVTEVLLRSWDPVSLAFFRLALGALVLNVAYALAEGPGVFFRVLPWPAIWRLGAMGIGVSTLILIFGIRYSNAIIAGIIITAGPVIGSVLARLMLGTPFRRGLWVGVALAVTGGIATVGGKAAGEAAFSGGEFLILISMVLWLSYSIGVQVHIKGVSQLGITALTALTGVVVLGGLTLTAFGVGLIEPHMSLDTKSVAMMVYLACGPASLSIFLWHWGISRAGVTVASMYSNLTPVIVVLIAMTYGSYPTWWHLVGGMLIVAGVLYVQLRPRFGRRSGRDGTA